MIGINVSGGYADYSAYGRSYGYGNGGFAGRYAGNSGTGVVQQASVPGTSKVDLPQTSIIGGTIGAEKNDFLTMRQGGYIGNAVSPMQQKGADVARMAVMGRMMTGAAEGAPAGAFGSAAAGAPAEAVKIPGTGASEDEAAEAAGLKGDEDVKSAQEVAEEGECQTCKERKYQDGSDDPSVSYKSPTKISPENARSAVMGHEMEHVAHEQAKAKQEDREVISQNVQIHTGICPECGKVYVSGGTTTTTTASKSDQGESAAEGPAAAEAGSQSEQ